MTPSTPPDPTPDPTAPLPRRHELFAHYVARGAGLAQAVRLAGYSPQGARQRGCVLISYPAIRRRAEVLYEAWMRERAAHVTEAVGRLDQIVELALGQGRATAALNAVTLQLKLRGVIHDPRAGLLRPSADDDLAKALFDLREDEDPPLKPPPEPVAVAEPPTEAGDSPPKASRAAPAITASFRPLSWGDEGEPDEDFPAGDPQRPTRSPRRRLH